MKLLVTGGSGFIGSALVRQALAETAHEIVNVDNLTYAAAPESLEGLPGERLVHERLDVCNAAALRRAFAEHRPDAVVHLAAESHVDRSLDAPALFVRTNVLGTHTLLETVRDYWRELPAARAARFRYVQVSTDEVFGSRPAGQRATVGSRYAPSSPYAASKAAADQLAWSYYRSWRLPVIVTHSCNNFGPWQYPEKLFPVAALAALEGRPIPLYGDGRHVRDWLYVDDHARALLAVAEAAEPGTAWGIGSDNERPNSALAEAICDAAERITGRRAATPRVRFVADRPGHDRHYGLESTAIRSRLAWTPRVALADGIEHTVRWYREHLDWCHERLGAGNRSAIHD
jgi:dTDP-glucose 4,6-dehydratase